MKSIRCKEFCFCFCFCLLGFFFFVAGGGGAGGDTKRKEIRKGELTGICLLIIITTG